MDKIGPGNYQNENDFFQKGRKEDDNSFFNRKYRFKPIFTYEIEMISFSFRFFHTGKSV
jgi:hypothetical protein